MVVKSLWKSLIMWVGTYAFRLSKMTSADMALFILRRDPNFRAMCATVHRENIFSPSQNYSRLPRQIFSLRTNRFTRNLCDDRFKRVWFVARLKHRLFAHLIANGHRILWLFYSTVFTPTGSGASWFLYEQRGRRMVLIEELVRDSNRKRSRRAERVQGIKILRSEEREIFNSRAPRA